MVALGLSLYEDIARDGYDLFPCEASSTRHCRRNLLAVCSRDHRPTLGDLPRTTHGSCRCRRIVLCSVRSGTDLLLRSLSALDAHVCDARVSLAALQEALSDCRNCRGRCRPLVSGGSLACADLGSVAHGPTERSARGTTPSRGDHERTHPGGDLDPHERPTDRDRPLGWVLPHTGEVRGTAWLAEPFVATWDVVHGGVQNLGDGITVVVALQTAFVTLVLALLFGFALRRRDRSIASTSFCFSGCPGRLHCLGSIEFVEIHLRRVAARVGHQSRNAGRR